MPGTFGRFGITSPRDGDATESSMAPGIEPRKDLRFIRTTSIWIRAWTVYTASGQAGSASCKRGEADGGAGRGPVGPPYRTTLRGVGIVEDADIVEIAVLLGVVEAVAYDELVGNLEADITDVHGAQAALGLVHEGGDADGVRPALI